MYDIAIVGAGPAGLTGGIYAGRAGKKVIIFEKNAIGGQITYTKEIDNFPASMGSSGIEFSMKLKEQAETFGAKIVPENIKSIEKKTDGNQYFQIVGGNDTYKAKSIILATGLSYRKTGLENEENLIGKGISFCAMCDGAFFRNKTVAVYGGGNTALEDASALSEICKNVIIIHRRNRFRGEEYLVKELEKKENVIFEMEKTISKLHGEDKISAITIKDVNTEKERIIEIDGLFVAIGQIPNGKEFENIAPLDDRGYYDIDEECKVEEGIFVAGDARKKSTRQLVTAVSDGAVAANAACRYIDKLKGNEYI